jgi:hypothetical protein
MRIAIQRESDTAAKTMVRFMYLRLWQGEETWLILSTLLG